MSRKNSNDTIGNRTRDLPVCSVVGRDIVQVLFQKTIHAGQMLSLLIIGLNIQLLQIKFRYNLAIRFACDHTGRKRVFSYLATRITTRQNKLKMGFLYINKI